jgi:hypothetical protein
MEKDRTQRYAESLERTIQNNHHYLKETIEDFQELCRLVTPERNVPREIILDIREMYKEIRNRLTEINAIQQLLHGKYRKYYHRDSLRDKEIMEFGFIAKNSYSKFEYTLMQIEAMKRLKEKEIPPKVDHEDKFFQWFHSKENQVTLIKNLRILSELDYETTPEEVGEEKRDVAVSRTLTLFLFKGDSLSLDKLQSQIQLREHDIIERLANDELRGVLTHLRKVDPSDVEKMFQRLMETIEFKKLKCLLLSIHSHQDLKAGILSLIKTTLQEMTEGEVKTLTI